METAVKEESCPADAAKEAISAVVPNRKVAYRFFKRFCDILLSLIAVVTLCIPLILISILIRLESEGPAIFTQERMGKGGKVFTIYKFRTMTLDAPSEMAAQEFTDSDKYVTKLGRFLRRTSVDELPQLLNILRGDMAIVGYRPVCLTETELNDLRMRYGVFAARPGITGLAQVSGRDNIGYEEKALLDARYVAERSVKMDIWCLIQTVRVVISGEGVN